MNSLDPMGIVYGAACLIYFVAWLICRRGERLRDALDSLPAAGVAFGALLIAPFFFYAAWHQIGAQGRLARENLPLSADFGQVVGAQGGRAPRYVWRFVALNPSEKILADYETAAVRAGWKIERKKTGFLMHQAGVTVTIWFEDKKDHQEIVIQKQTAPPS